MTEDFVTEPSSGTGDLQTENVRVERPSGERTQQPLDPRLTPKEAPGDVPDIGREYTTAGVDKGHWEHPEQRESHGT